MDRNCIRDINTMLDNTTNPMGEYLRKHCKIYIRCEVSDILSN